MIRRVAVCPHCLGDLEPDGPDGYWCIPCQRAVPFTEAVFFDDDQGDDDD